MLRRAFPLVALLVISLSAPGFPGPDAGAADWRRFDVTADGFLDRADVQVLFGDGLWHPAEDVDKDGEKGLLDAFALAVLMTRWDRSADLRIGDDDFAPAAELSLPEPDVAAATSLARRLLTEAAAKLPPGQEERLMREWPTFAALGRPEQAALLEEAGMLALVEHNLDVAQWAFARSVEIAPERDSALADLGFTLGQQGRSAEALTLLSRARQMDPRAGATLSNIGWMFARAGQVEEAARYYREAVAAAPEVAQYQINLGVVLLRRDDPAGAHQAFARASALNPDDREALCMHIATDPAKPGDMARYASGYEDYRAESNRQMEEETGQPGDQPGWDDLPASEKIDEMIRQEEERVRAERDAALASLTEETKDRLRQIVKPIEMQGRSAKEDWARFWSGFPGTFEQLLATEDAADLRASLIATEFKRRAAAAALGLDRMILALALAQAQADMVRMGGGPEGRRAFEQTVDDLYEDRMRWAAERLRTAHESWHLDLSPVDDETHHAATLTWMAIAVAAAADAAYGKDFFAKADPGAMSKIKFKLDDEPAFGLSLGIVGAEWKPESDEFKLQVGQGIIVAGTWSPANGFGFQVGTGVSITEGSLKVSTASYLKFGSDGSITVDYKVGAGASESSLGAKWSGSASTTLRAATHEPVGSLR